MINKRLQKHLNTSEHVVLFEKHSMPKNTSVRLNCETRYRYHLNGVKKYVAMFINGKLHEECYYNDEGQMHRDNDLPAWISTEHVRYYQNGELHRGYDNPAVISQDGSVEFWVNGCMYKKSINKRVAIIKLIKRFWREFKGIIKT